MRQQSTKLSVSRTAHERAIRGSGARDNERIRALVDETMREEGCKAREFARSRDRQILTKPAIQVIIYHVHALRRRLRCPNRAFVSE
jgi:hypothetical protein